MNVKVLSVIVLLLAAVNVNAEHCTKNFPYHFIKADGTLGLYQGTGGGWWYPCSVSTLKNGVTPEACKSALATYMAAKAQGKSITLRYSGTCAALNSSVSTQLGFSWFGVYW